MTSTVIPQAALLAEAENIAALLAYAEADREPVWVQLDVHNMDNMGKTRRDAIIALAHALGGGADSYSVRNTTGTGIYTFALDVIVPRVVAAYLRGLVPAMLAEADAQGAEAARGNRARMRAAGLSPRQVKAGDAVFRRGLLELRLAQYADAARAVLEGTEVDRVTLPEAAREAQAARKRLARARTGR